MSVLRQEAIIKEIQIKPRIAEHDLNTKINNVKRLLKKDKVRVTVVFRGREITHPDIGKKLLEKVISDTADVAKVEARGNRGNTYFAVLGGL